MTDYYLSCLEKHLPAALNLASNFKYFKAFAAYLSITAVVTFLTFANLFRLLVDLILSQNH